MDSSEHEVHVKVVPDITEVDKAMAERQLSPLGKCLACVVERKGAELAGKQPEDLPPLRDAIALMGGSGCCNDHIIVRQQSPLQIPGQVNGFGG